MIRDVTGDVIVRIVVATMILVGQTMRTMFRRLLSLVTQTLDVDARLVECDDSTAGRCC